MQWWCVYAVVCVCMQWGVCSGGVCSGVCMQWWCVYAVLVCVCLLFLFILFTPLAGGLWAKPVVLPLMITFWRGFGKNLGTSSHRHTHTHTGV